MFYPGVHAIIFNFYSPTHQKKLLRKLNSNTCTSPNSYPNNYTSQTIQTETGPSVSPSVFSAWGSPQKNNSWFLRFTQRNCFLRTQFKFCFTKIWKVFYFQPGGDIQQQSNCKQFNYQPINSVILLVFIKSIDPGRSQCLGS